MRWVIGPVADSAWFFSGPVIGLALIPVVMSGAISFAALLKIITSVFTAHVIAPFVAAWSHSTFRPKMVAEPGKFILLPLLLMALGILTGWLSWYWDEPLSMNNLTLAGRWDGNQNDPYAWLRSPFMWMTIIYFGWNIYHFCMQNYGLLRTYRPEMNRALAMQLAMFITVMLLIVLPEKYRLPQLVLFATGGVFLHHALTEIGMSSYVWAADHRRSHLWFAIPVLLLGFALTYGATMLSPGLLFTTLMGFRLALGDSHFLYGRWFHGDPQVKELFHGRTA